MMVLRNCRPKSHRDKCRVSLISASPPLCPFFHLRLLSQRTPPWRIYRGYRCHDDSKFHLLFSRPWPCLFSFPWPFLLERTRTEEPDHDDFFLSRDTRDIYHACDILIKYDDTHGSGTVADLYATTKSTNTRAFLATPRLWEHVSQAFTYVRVPGLARGSIPRGSWNAYSRPIIRSRAASCEFFRSFGSVSREISKWKKLQRARVLQRKCIKRSKRDTRVTKCLTIFNEFPSSV